MRYRLRIINMACQPAYTFSIDRHDLTIIEADGQLHKPYTVDSVTLYSGQRYSAILTANQTVGNYWIRAQPWADGLFFTDPFASGINSAILRYSGAPAVEPTTASSAGPRELVEAKLVPYAAPAAPGPATAVGGGMSAITLNYTLNDTAFEYDLDGSSPKLPSVPVLLQLMSGTLAMQNLPKGYFALPKNSVVQLSFPGAGTAPDTHHAIHLHGHPFSVIRSAGSSTYNFVNPPRRDVVSTGGENDNVTIRFTTNNNGRK
jgi:iron transport multicopper oxidase